jgi:hypothetical protein
MAIAELSSNRVGSFAGPVRISGFPCIRKTWKPQRWESDLGRNLNQITGELSPERHERLEVRYQELKQVVESLRKPRQITGEPQADIATALNFKRPSASKIEK